ncbi:MAG: sensor histidine kinase, partial [Bacteroidia bacterium]|nr:sensor histidine kinase [Bacteroidia bacterium]NNJ55726.1 sensor histidine kinase [Bacteroidia bacterium]
KIVKLISSVDSNDEETTVLKDMYSALIMEYVAIGNYDQAIKMQLNYNHLKQIENQKNQQLAFEAKSEVLESEDRLENYKVLAKQRELNKIEIEQLSARNETLKRASIGIGIVLSLFALVVYTNRKGSINADGYGKELLSINKDLKSSLDEKDSLLREIHHRVKNNLQLISSILSLEQGLGQTKSIEESISDTSSKIKSMALIHELFYDQNTDESINLKEYCSRLVQLISESYNSKASSVNVNVQCEDIFLEMDKVTPLGLIINECISNSLKYAYEVSEGVVDVSIVQKSDEIIVIIQDYGKGLNKDFNLDEIKSLGIKLIKRLTEKQLHGSYRIENKENGGVLNEVKFKIE